MSTGYDVIVPKGRWPGVAALDRAMAARGFPVALVSQPDPGAAVREVKRTLGLPVLLEGRRIELEAMIGVFDPSPDDETNETLEMIGADFRATPGDHLFSVALRASPEEWTAASYVMATLVLDFDGYGYEMQAESHGRAEWAEELIDAARRGFPAAPAPAAPRSRAEIRRARNALIAESDAARPRKRFVGSENFYWLLFFMAAAPLGWFLAMWKHS